MKRKSHLSRIYVYGDPPGYHQDSIRLELTRFVVIIGRRLEIYMLIYLGYCIREYMRVFIERFSPNSIYIFVYNIELGLSLFGRGLFGVGWGGLGCLYGFFCWGWLRVFVCWVLVVAWLISF